MRIVLNENAGWLYKKFGQEELEVVRVEGDTAFYFESKLHPGYEESVFPGEFQEVEEGKEEPQP